MGKTIEIPFGAKDSELKGWEYTIPENMDSTFKQLLGAYQKAKHVHKISYMLPE